MAPLPVMAPSAGTKPVTTEPFRLIVITPEKNIPGEQEIVHELFAAGLSRLHLRKPGYSSGELQAWLAAFDSLERKNMVVHHTDRSLLGSGITGLHLPCSDLLSFPEQKTCISTSVHQPEEYRRLSRLRYFNELEYAFISPLFNSISKPGYRRNPDTWYLPSQQGLPLIGLGGIHLENILSVRQAGFRGAALLGALWKNPEHAVEIFNKICQKIAHAK